MRNLIANSVFWANRREYRPGDTIPADLPDLKELLKKGFVVYRDGRKAVEAEEQEAGEADDGNVSEQGTDGAEKGDETGEAADDNESSEAAAGDESGKLEEKSANVRKRGTDK